MVKVFAIGNYLMSDDKIGLLIGEKLIEELKEYQVQVFICETDIGYALSNIEENDFIIIIDAMHRGGKSGEIEIFPISDLERIITYTQHSLSLLSLINFYNIKGYIIGIEAADLGFGIGLSQQLRELFNDIYNQVLKGIKLFIIKQ